MQRVKISVLLTFLLSTQAQALVASFPTEIQDRAVIQVDEPKLLSLETPEEKLRPVWLHGGDSISTAWASGTTLRERLARAENGELPRPGSLRDSWTHFPSLDFSWYAGRANGFGLFGWLERSTEHPWVVVSVARIGARYQGKRVDPVEVMSSIKSLNRVKLVTFSLGGNDLCRNSHVVDQPEAFVKRLKEFKSKLPADAVVVPFDVPDVVTLRASIMQRLEALPNSTGKTRVLNYCRENWDVKNCSAVTRVPAAKLNEMRKKMHDGLVEVFGGVFDLDETMNNMDVLDLMAEDCFHPSRLVQKPLAEALERYIAPRLKMD